jgi:type IV secretion system protein VirD4
MNAPKTPKKLTTYKPTHVSIPLDPLVKSRANTILWSAIIVYGLLGMWAGTEAFAALRHFPIAFKKQQLGTDVYLPWAAIYPWGRVLGNKHIAAAQVHLLIHDFAIAYAIMAIGLTLAIMLGVHNRKRFLANPQNSKDYHGSGIWGTAIHVGATEMLPPEHWASQIALKSKNRELRLRGKSGTRVVSPEEWRAAPGIFLGEWYDEKTKKRYFLRDCSDKHIGLYAPTRGGKGVGVIVPALLSWSGSAVINDPKGELYELTSGFRKHVLRQRIFRFDPLCMDGTSACINVLDFIKLRTDMEVADAQNIALMVCDPQGQGLDTGESSDHWKKTSVAFLVAVVLHVLYSREIPKSKKNLAGVDEFLSDPSRTLQETYELMQNYEHDPDHSRGWTTLDGRLTATCPTIANAAKMQADRPKDEGGSVISSLQSYFDIYRDPIVKLNTSHSDFSIEDLMYAKQAASLYLINNPNMMERIRPLIRLIVNCMMTTFCGAIEFDEQHREKKRYQNKLLMCLDEFTSTLSKMSILANGLAFVSGYGIKLLIVVQDIAQLVATYGEHGAQAITSNLHTEVIFSTKNPKTAGEFSTMLGESTLRIETRSWERVGGMFGRGKASLSESYIGRPLLTTSEIQTMPETEMVVMVTNTPPIYCKKLRYYDEPFLKKRLLDVVDKSDSIPQEDQAFYTHYREELKFAETVAQRRRDIALVAATPAPVTTSIPSTVQRLLAATSTSDDSEAVPTF